ncbi:hypothetical protein BASA81_001839 [Batrachochytrium salamandrivorans]|nr:hypothetical protein BASA81_001839 [Batrachochytrium salamandrivorans]
MYPPFSVDRPFCRQTRRLLALQLCPETAVRSKIQKKFLGMNSLTTTTTATTNKALQEAQGVLKEIRDKCARALQDTKRLEAEAKSVDLRRENLEREVHSTCAECASLEEDCLQQEAYLAEFPHRIQQSTVKSEEILQQWSKLDREATLVLDTASQVHKTKENRLAQAHHELHSAKHKLHLLEVWKVKQISQIKLELETALQRKSQLEFQFANQKSTLACSEKVTLEAQQVLDDRRLVALTLETQLGEAKAKEIVIPLVQQEELHMLHMENETKALELAKQEHATKLAMDLLEHALEAGNRAHGKLETELAEARQQVDVVQAQVQAKHAEFALEEERLENELVGLEQEQDLLIRQAEEAQSEVAARIVRLKQDEQEQIQRERLVLEAELATLTLQWEVLEQRSVDQAKQMVELELARERKLVLAKQAELDLLERQREEEAARVALKERQESEARLEEEARVARAAKDEAKKAKKAEQADRKQRALEEKLAIKRQREADELEAKRQREAAEEEFAIKKKQQEEEFAIKKKQQEEELAIKKKQQEEELAIKKKQQEEDLAIKKKQQEEEEALLKANKAREKKEQRAVEKALVQKQRAEAAAKLLLEQHAAQNRRSSSSSSDEKEPMPPRPTKTQPLTRRGSSRAATQALKPQQQRKSQPLPVTAVARIQSTTPDWVRKQIAGTYKPSPVREEPSSSEEEAEAKPLVRRTTATATYSRKSSLPTRKPTMTTTTPQADNDNDSASSQFDLFDE